MPRTSYDPVMSKANSTLRSKAPRDTVPLDHTSIDASGKWLVLIGGGEEASDPDDVLRFLREMWPDVECDAAIKPLH